MNTTNLIDEIFTTGRVLDQHGQVHLLGANVDQDEGEFLRKMIALCNAQNTIEVGCAMGISSLYICSALAIKQEKKHTIIDPMQSTDWENIGRCNLDRAGVDFYQIIEEPSETALPRLLAEGHQFDFGFIDGWHTFDHTLLDFYYLDRLIKVGGIIVIDDVSFSGIRKAVRYILNYPNYELVGTVKVENHRNLKKRLYDGIISSFVPITKCFPKKMAYRIFSSNIIERDEKLGINASMVALRKVADDNRRWDWYEDF